MMFLIVRVLQGFAPGTSLTMGFGAFCSMMKTSRVRGFRVLALASGALGC